MRNLLLRFAFPIFITIFCFTQHVNAYSTDSSRIRISLLTCSPGDELYSIFGHSAIRVIDSNSVTDIVFNYGTFNFDDEGFYLKFIQGKLLYYVSAARFDDFRYEYESSNRGMTEQLLDLSEAEKKQIQQALIENLKEENKYYKYDFFFDNCTTRLRDLIVKSKHPNPILPPVMPANTRFRQAIHQYLDKGDQQWSKWGIDILLGAPTDRVMTASEQQFLPDNLMKALDGSENTRIVASSEQVYTLGEMGSQKSFFTPLFFFTSLLLVFVMLHAAFRNTFPLLMIGLDGLLFFLTGLLGILLVFMWTATDHSMTKDNYNLLWALPTHLVISFFVKSQRNWVKKYFLFTSIAGLILLCAWYFLPQQLPVSMIPFVILIIFRCITRCFQGDMSNSFSTKIKKHVLR